MADATETERPTPPYVSFRTFDGFIATLSEAGLPPVIDSSVMSKKSGAIQSQLRIAMRFLDLTDEDGRVKPRFRELVDAHGTPEWQETLGEVITTAYEHLVEGLPTKGTAKQLHDRFRERGDVSGSTLAKAVRFYLNAMDAAELEYSPYFEPPTVRSSSPARKRRKPKKPESADGKPSTAAPPRKAKEEVEAARPAWPKDYRDIKLALPGRAHEVVVVIPEDITPAEWGVVDTFIRSFIDLSEEG